MWGGVEWVGWGWIGVECDGLGRVGCGKAGQCRWALGEVERGG